CGLFCRFQRNVLDLSLQWRFANLPNNAKLEMVPISRSRQGPENTVRIALQLDDGTRLQDTFCSGQTLWELLSHFAQTRNAVHEGSAVCPVPSSQVAGRASLQATTLKSLGLTGGSAIIRFAMKPCSSAGVSRSKAPGSPTASLSADQAAGSPLLPLDSAGLSQGDVSHQDEAGISGASRVDAQAKQISKEPAPTPFVPFSGGGQRLGGSSGLAKSLMSPSAKLPKSFSSPGGPSKPKKSKPGQEPRPEPEPVRSGLGVEVLPPERSPLPTQLVDRDPVVCHPDLEELLQAWPTELPDEFFEVTVDDVRRRLAQLRSERKRLEEAPLVTKAFREAQMREKLERYPKVVLRVLFPDRYILQGFFHPNETVGDLHAFVRSHLGNPELPFCLFITPPKTVLDDPTLTLFQVPGLWRGAGGRGCRNPASPTPAREGDSGEAVPGLVGWGAGSPVQHCHQPPPRPPPSSSCGRGFIPPGPGSSLPRHYPERSQGTPANLFPAALVHFGAEEPTGLFLEPRLLEHTVSPSAADVLVARCMSRAAGTPPPMLAPDPAPLEVEPTAEAEAVGPPEPSTGTAPPVRRDLGKVPKWLKLPGT
ncbi:hypothetical protein PANDA_000693, partial [Ailuropoda melanoleuca]